MFLKPMSPVSGNEYKQHILPFEKSFKWKNIKCVVFFYYFFCKKMLFTFDEQIKLFSVGRRMINQVLIIKRRKNCFSVHECVRNVWVVTKQYLIDIDLSCLHQCQHRRISHHNSPSSSSCQKTGHASFSGLLQLTKCIRFREIRGENIQNVVITGSHIANYN